jgi:hypothetical protein
MHSLPMSCYTPLCQRCLARHDGRSPLQDAAEHCPVNDNAASASFSRATSLAWTSTPGAGNAGSTSRPLCIISLHCVFCALVGPDYLSVSPPRRLSEYEGRLRKYCEKYVRKQIRFSATHLSH